MLRLIVAFSYGSIVVISLLSAVGLALVDDERGKVIAGWVFCAALLFAIGRLADLARSDRAA